MRRLRDCLRLKNTGISTREIARRVGIASSTVRLTLRRCEAAGIAWPLASDLTDALLEQRLFANSGTKQGTRCHEEANWAAVHRELKRKHVALAMLLEEYIERHPDGYRYSQLVDRVDRFPVMHGGATEGVDGELEAGGANGLHIDNVAQIGDVGQDKIVLLRRVGAEGCGGSPRVSPGHCRCATYRWPRSRSTGSRRYRPDLRAWDCTLNPPSSGGLCEGVRTMPSARRSPRSRLWTRIARDMTGVGVTPSFCWMTVCT